MLEESMLDTMPLETADVASTPEVETVETPEVATETPVETQSIEQTETQQPEKVEELAEFKGSVAAQLREMAKQAPGLDALLNKFPAVRDRLAATFRREAAYREFGTVAEMRDLREAFPRGKADVDDVFAELEEINKMDTAFVSRDAQGTFPGHGQLINKWYEQDPEAAKSLLRTIPKEWARIDPSGYNEVMSKIVGATLQGQGALRHVAQLKAALTKANQPELAESMGELEGWMQSFLAEKPAPSEEERRLTSERTEFNRQKTEQGRESAQRFHQEFMAQSGQLQKDIVEKHPLLARLPQSIPASKKAEIVNKVVAAIRDHLGKNTSFMRALRPAYNKMDGKAVADLQRHAWSQPWLLNMYVRKILAAETPGVVQASRPAARQPAGKPAARPSAQGKARHVGGQWYKADGSLFSVEEVLRGEHLN